MTTQPIILARYGKAKRADQIGLTATNFLMLCLWIGPNRACFFIAIAAALALWFWLCRRFPLFAIFSMGFIGGLTGSRGSYRPWFAYRCRRR
jgi:hypothetical protein